VTFEQQMFGFYEYRSYIMSNLYGSNLYASPADILDPGFESPIQATGASTLDPTSSPWTFTGTAGLAGNGSAITANDPSAPQGNQVAYLEQTGTISQTMDYFPAAGAYQLSFSAAQSGTNGGNDEEVQVQVDGTVVGTFTPANSAYATYTTGTFNLTAGPHTVTFLGVDPSGANVTALLDQVSINNVASTAAPLTRGFVNLLSAFNRTGIVSDGTTFSAGGLDDGGFAFSANQLGTSVFAGGTVFVVGPDGVADVISTAGQTIALPSSNDSVLKLLATGVNGNQPNQTFTVTYTDGTTATFTQSISDWAFPQGYSGESTALAANYRDTSTGTEQAQPVNVYEYSFALNPSKSVRSITLPDDGNVEVFAATLVPVGTTQVDISSAFNRTGIAVDGTSFVGGGLDGDGYAFSASLLGTSVTAGVPTFNIGPAGAADVVSAAGQTINLPSGNDSALELLATGVNGSQVNQTFTVTYTDGTTATFTQSISDWAFPQGYSGESTVLTTRYRDTSSGSAQTDLEFNVYEYTFALDSTKAVRSITLPNDANVEVLAADLIPAGTTQIDLFPAFNRAGIEADGATFSGGGLDGDGTALSFTQVGTSLTTGGSIFDIGPAGANDVVSATGQTITVPSGRYTEINLLATAVNGSQPNQSFTVTYADGTSATFTQSISDWAFPQGYPGESTVLTASYRDTSSGTEQALQVNVYEYTFVLNSTKGVSSITLPNNAHVMLLAATLVPAVTAEVNLSVTYNRTGIVADTTTFGGGGLDGIGNAFSSSQIGTTLTAGGATFAIGAVGAHDVVSASGQTIALPSGNDSALELLATGVNGGQVNQTFTVTYTDETTATFTQSISDWAVPQGYAGESAVLTTRHRDLSNGTEQAGAYNVYEYTFVLDPTKTVSSITLPDDGNVEVLAIDAQP
jgi:Protein of unknown function (DUF642)